MPRDRHQEFLYSFTVFGRMELERRLERQQRMIEEIDEEQRTNPRRADYLRFIYARHG